MAPLALALLLAQAAPKLDIRVDGAAQAAPKAVTDTFDVPVNVENERVTANYPHRGGPAFSIAGRYRVWKRLTLGGGVSTFARRADAAIDAAVPHPFFDNQPRMVQGTAAVRRDETATHVAVGWQVPVTERIQLEVSAGPVFMHARQGFVTGIAIAETYPYDTASFKSADVRNSSRGATGAYAGADVRWLFMPHLGVGGIVQFTHARVREKVGNRTVGVDAGGLHGGGGIRFAF